MLERPRRQGSLLLDDPLVVFWISGILALFAAWV